MKKRPIEWTALLLAVILLLLPQQRSHAEEAAEPEAVRIDIYCTYRSDFTKDFTALTDYNFKNALCVPPGRSVTIAWQADAPVAFVFLAFMRQAAPYSVQQHDAAGTLLSETAGTQYLNNRFEVAPSSRSMTFTAGAQELSVYALSAYRAGLHPHYFEWAPTPEKADYLLLATHPDDDVLFLGGVIPIYTGEQGRVGAAAYLVSHARPRVDEALAGAWTMGLRTEPIQLGFEDRSARDEFWERSNFSHEMLTLALVRTLRQTKPEIVVTQDENGEYGHWQHKAMVRALREAIPLAADAAYDPVSAEGFGTWAVKKLYLHLYAENRLQLPVDMPLARFGGKIAVEVASEAFQCHKTQLGRSHSVKNEGIYSLSDFGLAYSTVGPDTPGVNDMFEHIYASALHPLAEPTSVPTTEPTPAPRPKPIGTSPSRPCPRPRPCPN